MNCRELTDFLSDYVAGDLPTTVSADFEGHLGRCPECHLFLDQYRTTIRLSASAYAEPVPHPLPDDLVRAIMAALGKST
jgi:anti-sigma factor RsiW